VVRGPFRKDRSKGAPRGKAAQMSEMAWFILGGPRPRQFGRWTAFDGLPQPPQDARTHLLGPPGLIEAWAVWCTVCRRSKLLLITGCDGEQGRFLHWPECGHLEGLEAVAVVAVCPLCRLAVYVPAGRHCPMCGCRFVTAEELKHIRYLRPEEAVYPYAPGMRYRKTCDGEEEPRHASLWGPYAAQCEGCRHETLLDVSEVPGPESEEVPFYWPACGHEPWQLAACGEGEALCPVCLREGRLVLVRLETGRFCPECGTAEFITPYRLGELRFKPPTGDPWAMGKAFARLVKALYGGAGPLTKPVPRGSGPS